jgi:hypothetical protein
MTQLQLLQENAEGPLAMLAIERLHAARFNQFFGRVRMRGMHARGNITQ